MSDTTWEWSNGRTGRKSLKNKMIHRAKMERKKLRRQMHPDYNPPRCANDAELIAWMREKGYKVGKYLPHVKEKM